MRLERLRRRLRHGRRGFRHWRRRIVGVLGRGEDSVRHWLLTRHYRSLLHGSPAIVVAALVVCATLGQAGKPKSALADRYKWAARQALERQDLAAAELYARKVLQLSESDPEARFLLAQVARQRGEHSQADKLLSELAPSDAAGYPPAHFLLAARLLQTKKTLSQQELSLLTHHLQESAAQASLRIDAQRTLGQVYFLQRDWDRALRCFQDIVAQRPETRLWIANIHLLRGESSRAKSELSQAVAWFQDRCRAHPEDTKSRLLLAHAFRLLGNWPEAERVLRERFEQPDGQRCRLELAALCVTRADQLRSPDSAANLDQRLDLLRQALQCSPGHPAAISRVAALAGLTSDDAKLDRDVLKNALAAGHSAAMVHLLLGTLAADAGESASAQIHLQQAYHLDPVAAPIFDSLVLLLVNREPPETERALRLAEVAIEAWPEIDEARATRDNLRKN